MLPGCQPQAGSCCLWWWRAHQLLCFLLLLVLWVMILGLGQGYVIEKWVLSALFLSLLAASRGQWAGGPLRVLLLLLVVASAGGADAVWQPGVCLWLYVRM
jgi:hypothetical protein